jgi:hypothetical protein
MFVFAQIGEMKRLHYKMVTVSGEKGCVEGVISDKTAKHWRATLGQCYDVNCIHYRGSIKLPFCCEITGYSCNEYI